MGEQSILPGRVTKIKIAFTPEYEMTVSDIIPIAKTNRTFRQYFSFLFFSQRSTKSWRSLPKRCDLQSLCAAVVSYRRAKSHPTMSSI